MTELHTFSDLDTFLVDYSEFAVVEFCAGSNISAKPSLDDLKAKFKHVTFARLSVESLENFAYIDRYNIGSTPTFALFKEKEVVERIGANDLDGITAAINKHAPAVEEKPDDIANIPNVLPARAIDSMWNSPALANADSRALPPSRHFEDTLSQLRITLLSKTQHKAVHVVDGSLVEPTLALFCPIEGGEYAIDATVKELAGKTNSEVQVIDMVQIAAGEWGVFGKLASGFRLKNNPLGKIKPTEDQDDDDDGDKNLKALESFWRIVVESNPPAPVATSTPEIDAAVADEAAPTTSKPRPRIIYIRDFGLLAPRVSTWFPPLYSAIRARRTNGLGPKSPIANPTTVIFGVSPPLSSALPTAAEGGGCSCESCRPSAKKWDESATKERAERLKALKEKWDKGTLLKDLPSFRPRVKITKQDLEKEQQKEKEIEEAKVAKEVKEEPEDTPKGESEEVKGETKEELEDLKEESKHESKDEPAATTGTESKAEKDEELVQAVTEEKDEPKNESDAEAKEEGGKEGTDEAEPKAEETPKDSDGTSDSGSSSSSSSSEESDSDFQHKLDGYFRSCIIAPAKRNAKLERASRETRRREVNELMLRMNVGIKGGEIESGAAPVPVKEDTKENEGDDKAKEKTKDKTKDEDKEADDDMMKGWEERLLESDALKSVVERALEVAMLANEDEQGQEPTQLTWASLQDAWRANKSSDEERKAWTKDNDDSSDKDDDEKKDEEKAVDEVVEKVKAASDLDEYEQRLLGCIVDVAKLSTSFENVHLPAHVIDNVRSIVSLPLLYPEAFKSGILKQQAISGALLFGPPGTGKTLVVRALAKESGSRMMAIKPSDIADKWVGETEKLVRSLFKLARRLKPCVVFIDEIDSIMGSRTGNSSGGSRWHTSMLTEFMQEMDGLMASSVIVIGATNRPSDVDDAVLRRLPCRLLVDLPGVEAREEILKIMLKDDELGPDVDIGDLARKTDRFSGSDLKHLCVAAAMDALKENVKLPWLAKKEESKDASGTKPDDTSKSKPAAEKEKEKDSASDDGSSLYPSDPNSESPSTGVTTPEEKPEALKPRILVARHFVRALMDVAPSSSESQGSLSELRKWNTQFGTGAREQPRTTGSLPYNYGGARSSLTGSSGVPGIGGSSSYSSSGLGSTGLGSSGLGSGGMGSSGLGSGRYGSSGLGATGMGASGLGSSGLGSAGLGSSGLGSSGLGSSGIGSSGLGYTGLGSSGLGSSGLGSTGLGSTGLGSTGLGSTGLGSTGLGGTGLGSSSFNPTGLGSTGLGSTGLGSLGSLGLGSSGLGSSGIGSPGLSSLSGLSNKGSGAPGANGYTPPTYTPPGIGGTSTGYMSKLPGSPGIIPGYTPSTPGGGPSAPGS